MQSPYRTDFQCSYRSAEDGQQDALYRGEFLRAFGLKEWEDSQVRVCMARLLAIALKVPGMSLLLNRIRRTYPEIALQFGGEELDDLSAFQLMFSFDLFDKAHKVMCDALEKGELITAPLDASIAM